MRFDAKLCAGVIRKFAQGARSILMTVYEVGKVSRPII